MKIISIETQISDWQQTNEDYEGMFTYGESPFFKLYSATPYPKKVVVIAADIHRNNDDTDFILDIKIASVVEFESDNHTPTSEQIYDLYLTARKQWTEKITDESIRRGIFIVMRVPAKPFETHRKAIEKAISDSFIQN